MFATYLDFLIVFFVILFVLNGTRMVQIFLSCYLPLLIFLPNELVSPFQGLPHTTPAQTVMLVLGGLFLLIKFKSWKFSYMDALILIYISLYNYSEFTAEISEKAERTIAVELTASLTEVLFPYMLAKSLIGLQGLHVAMAQRLVFLVFLVTLLMPLELRMTYDPFYYFLIRFYDFGTIPEPLLRHGFMRYMGPFTHPILAGSILAICLLLDIWLIRNDLWEKMRKYYKWFILFMLGLSLLATFSRAPLVGFGLGYIVSRIGYKFHHRVRSVFTSLILMAAFTGAVYAFFSSYVDINTEVATNESEGTLEYRLELLPTFIPVVEERFWLGWGNLGWPTQTDKVESIDNHYLWLALRHGVLTLSIFVAMPIFMAIKLFWAGLKLGVSQKLASSLIFTFFGIFCAQLLIYYTVFMGGQTPAIFFILLGWAEGLLLYLQSSHEDIPNIQIENYKSALRKLRKT